MAVFRTSDVEARVSFDVKRITGLSIGTDSPQAIALAELNKDGHADILAVGAGADDVQVFLNDGMGGFPATPVTYPTGAGPRAVTTGDFDRDGKLDIVVVNADDNTVTLWFGDGTGHFNDPRTYDLDPDNLDPVGVVAADFNGDRADDLAVLASETIYLLKSNADRTFTPFATPRVRTFGTDGFAITSGRLNADSFIDLVTSNSSSGNVSVLLGKGDGTFQPASLFHAGDMVEGIVVGQFNSGTDAFADIAVISGIDVDVGVTFLFGNGDGTFQDAAKSFDEIATIAIAALDIDRDGKADLATTNTVGALGVDVLCQQPGRTCVETGPAANPIENGFQLQLPPVGFGDAIAVQVGEINGDGKPDFVVLGAMGDEIGVFINTTSEVPPTPTFAGPTSTPLPTFITLTPTPTATASATSTPSTTPTPQVRIVVGPGTGRPGEKVDVTVSLVNSGLPVAATGNEIVFDASVVVIPTEFQYPYLPPRTPTPPACRVNPAVDKSLIWSVQTSETFDVDTGKERLVSVGRFFVVPDGNTGAIPEGPLYSCTFQIASSALPGEYALVNDLALAFAPDGTRVEDVSGDNGVVTVSLFAPTRVPVVRAHDGGCAIDRVDPGTPVLLIVPVALMWARQLIRPTRRRSPRR